MHLSHHHHHPPPHHFPGHHGPGPAPYDGMPPSPPPPPHSSSHHHHHHHHHCCCAAPPPPPPSRSRALSSASRAPPPPPLANVPLIERIPELNAGNTRLPPPVGPPLSPSFASPRRSPSPPGTYGSYHPSSLSPGIGKRHHHHLPRPGNGAPGRPRALSGGGMGLPPPPAYQEDGPLIHRIPPMGAPGNNGPLPAWGMRGKGGHHHGGWR